MTTRINFRVALAVCRITAGIDKTDRVLGFVEIMKAELPCVVGPKDLAFTPAGIVGRGIKGTEAFRKLGVVQGWLQKLPGEAVNVVRTQVNDIG